MLGVWLISASLAGFFRGRLSRLNRILFGIAGLMALVPEGAFEGARLTDVIGIGLGLLLILLELIRHPKPATGEHAQ